MHAASDRRERGRSSLGIAFLGAGAVLFFHPGALDMDRLKWDLLLCAALPVLLLSPGFRRLRDGLTAPLPAAWIPAALLPAAFAVSLLPLGLMAPEGVRVLAELLILLLLAAGAGVAVREGAGARCILAGFLAAGALAGLYGLLQAAGIDPFYLENPRREAVSFAGNTNALAEVLAILLPPAVALAAARSSRNVHRAALFSLPFLVGGLWVTGSRGGVLAAVSGIALTAATLLHARRARGEQEREAGETRAPARILLAAAGVGIGLVLGLLFGQGRALRLKNIDTDASILSAEYPTTKVRIEIWKSTLRLVQDHPLLGAGAGRFRYAFPPYRSAEEARIPGLLGAPTEVTDPHDEFLWAAAEAGLPAALLLAAALACMAAAALRGARDPGRGPEQRVLSAGVLGTIAAFLVLALVRAPLHNPASAALFFILTGCTGLAFPGARAHPPSSLRARLSFTAAPLILLLLAVAGLWFGGRGLAAGLSSASVGLAERIGPEQYARLQHAADLDPWNLDLQNLAGQAAGNTLAFSRADRDGRYRMDAFRRLIDVVRRNPWHAGALRTLARLRALEGNGPGALRLMERYLAVRHEPGNPAGEVLRLLEKERRYEEAAALGGATASIPPSLLLARGKALLKSGNPSAAARYADAYLSRRSFQGDGLYLLGRALEAKAGGSGRDAFRRMHLAYALDWLEKGNLRQAERSLRASRRYGEGAGEAPLLSAVLDAAKGAPFVPPEKPCGNRAFLERIQALARAGKLPPGAAAYVGTSYRR